MLFTIAIAPIFIILMFVYVKDRYEKEPLILLGLGVLFGLFLIPIVLCNDIFLMETELYSKYPVIMQAFVTSAGNEEGMKLIILIFLIYRNPNFNEPLDGMIYAIFISLGFAAGENVVYVFHKELGGIETAIVRSICSVPAHGIFAAFMGYYFSKFRYLKLGVKYLFFSFLIPWIAHAIYNLILIVEIDGYLFLFIPYLCFIFISAVKKFKKLLNLSPFKP